MADGSNPKPTPKIKVPKVRKPSGQPSSWAEQEAQQEAHERLMAEVAEFLKRKQQG